MTRAGAAAAAAAGRPAWLAPGTTTSSGCWRTRRRPVCRPPRTWRPTCRRWRPAPAADTATSAPHTRATRRPTRPTGDVSTDTPLRVVYCHNYILQHSQTHTECHTPATCRKLSDTQTIPGDLEPVTFPNSRTFLTAREESRETPGSSLTP